MLEFRLLGTLEVLYNGASVKIPGGKPQVILAILLIRGRPTSTTNLVEMLWPGRRPAKPEDCLYVHVSMLRKAFTDAGIDDPVEKTPCGYRIAPGSGQTDIARFGTLIAQGREAAARDALDDAWTSYTRALTLFDNDEPLSGVRYPAQLDDDMRNLTDERLAARKAWCEIGLRLGRCRQVLPVLRLLHHSEPLHEAVYELLLAAEYQEGGQPRGLSVYREIRDQVIEESGCDPSPRLRWMHDQILQGLPAVSLLDPAMAAV